MLLLFLAQPLRFTYVPSLTDPRAHHPTTKGDPYNYTTPPCLPKHEKPLPRLLTPWRSGTPARRATVQTFVATSISNHDRAAVGTTRRVRLRTEPEPTHRRSGLIG